MSLSKWYKMPPTVRITSKEYDANIQGLNIVFGAVLGFVLAGVEGLPVFDFMTVLFVSAFAAILILYLGSSEYRLFYFATTAGLIAFIPLIFAELLKIQPIPYLQPTLAVWATMVVLVELMPREETQDTKERDQ